MTSLPTDDISPEHARPVLRAFRSRCAIARMLIVALVLLGADLALKHFAFEHVAGQPVDIGSHGVNSVSAIPYHNARTVIPGVLSLRLTLNQGAVFGLGQGYRWVFVVISMIALIVIGTVFCRSRATDRLLHIGLAMVLSGALGNLYDRISYAMVRDMLYLFPEVELPFGWSWPSGDRGLYPWIFNIADVALLAGMAVLFAHVIRAEVRAKRAGNTMDAAAE